MIREISTDPAIDQAEGRVSGRRKKLDAAKRRDITESVITDRPSEPVARKTANVWPCRNLCAKSADLKSVWIQHTTLCAVLQSIDNTE